MPCSERLLDLLDIRELDLTAALSLLLLFVLGLWDEYRSCFFDTIYFFFGLQRNRDLLLNLLLEALLETLVLILRPLLLNLIIIFYRLELPEVEVLVCSHQAGSDADLVLATAISALGLVACAALAPLTGQPVVLSAPLRQDLFFLRCLITH